MGNHTHADDDGIKRVPLERWRKAIAAVRLLDQFPPVVQLQIPQIAIQDYRADRRMILFRPCIHMAEIKYSPERDFLEYRNAARMKAL